MELFERKYKVSSLIVNSAGRLGLYSLLNILQDTAWEHAHQLGHGHSESLGRNTFWVLTRQKIRMEKWPMWGDEFTVRTWIRVPEAGAVIRDFELVGSQGEILGEATTGWLLLDASTRRPSKLDVQTLIDPLFLAQKAVSIDPVKISVAGDFKELTRFEVRNSDLDVNKHVNNTKYAQWVLDAIPLEWHHRFLLKAYEVNFLAETHLKDVVSIEKAASSSETQEELKIGLFRGVRVGDGKTVFVARTISSERDPS